MSIPTPNSLAPLAEGTTVHVEVIGLPVRFGTIVTAHPKVPHDGHGTLHRVRLDDGAFVTVYQEALCPILMLPAPDHCRGRWDFHPPAHGLQ